MADPLADPLFVGLLALSSIAAAIIILSSLRRDGAGGGRRYQPPPAGSPGYAPHPPPQQWAEPPGQPEPQDGPLGDRFAWVRDARRFLIDIRNTMGLPTDQRCGYCGAPLHVPGALGYRAIHFQGWARREFYCRRCGKALWQYSPQGAHESAELRQEAQALAPPLPTVAISPAQPKQEQEPEAGGGSRQPKQPEPAKGQEGPAVAAADEKLRSLTPRQLLHLLFTCGGCIHFDEDSETGCTAIEYSKRTFRTTRTHRICSWWNQQRILAVATAGRLDVNTRYIDDRYPSGRDKDILEAGAEAAGS